MLEAVLILLGILFLLIVVVSALGTALWALISALVVGLVIGGLARLVVPNTRGTGLLPTTLLGLVGSTVGSFIGDNVLATNGFLTVLIEIGTAALAIVLYYRYRGQEDAPIPRG